MIFAASLEAKFLVIFFLEITFPAWSCWLRKCCHYTQVLSTNFINVTILLKLVLASAFQELSKWHSTIGNYCISPWKDLLKQHENLEVFNRESNTENRTFTFLKMSQWLWERLGLYSGICTVVAPVSPLPDRWWEWATTLMLSGSSVRCGAVGRVRQGIKISRKQSAFYPSVLSWSFQ